MKTLLRFSISPLILLLLAFSFQFESKAFQKEISIEELLNHTVGGVWVSSNEKNDTSNPNDFKSFRMKFENWGGRKSVKGDIYGITNGGDTTSIMQVWNFLDEYKKNITLIQRTSWGEQSMGEINVFEKEHFDITFKATTAQGQEYYIRDIHYIIGNDEMKAETYQKMKEEDEWMKVSESVWNRKSPPNE